MRGVAVRAPAGNKRYALKDDSMDDSTECNEWDILQRCKQVKEDHRGVVKQLDLVTAGIIFTRLGRPGENISFLLLLGSGESHHKLCGLNTTGFYFYFIVLEARRLN